MYIRPNQHQCLGDENGAPLPRGTAVALIPFPQHAGFVDYTIDGEQVVLHKSKRHKRAVVTWPEEFNEGRLRHRVLQFPENERQADEWLRRAYADDSPWTGADNCQDFVWQAITGRKKSPTRDAIIGLGAVATIAFALFG